jgi:predicted transcriptional regulator
MAKFPDSIKEYINVGALRAYTKTLEAELSVLKALHEHLGLNSRGRKSGKPKTAGKTSKRGPRGKVKKAVLTYLKKNQKGKAIEIAKLSGLKVASVNQTLFKLKKSGHVIQDAKRGSPFVLVKK